MTQGTKLSKSLENLSTEKNEGSLNNKGLVRRTIGATRTILVL